MIGKSTYRITIIEPSAVVRQGLRALLEENGEFKVTEEFDDYQSFADSNNSDQSHLILINPAIVSFYKPFSIRSFFANYSDNYIVAVVYNYVDSTTLSSFDSVLDIYDSGELMIRKLMKLIKSEKHSDDSGLSDNVDLSEREKEILALVAKGMTNKEIADRLFISTHTVISHRKNITRKTGVKTVSGLTLYAVFNNLISEEDI